MKSTIFKNENVLYVLILALALAVRLGGLGAHPLNESEAVWAWQAYQVAKGEAAALGAQPAYVLLTGLLFNLFGSSTGLARLLPALVGSFVVVLPFALREKLGRWAALLFALGLALDPGLVLTSRQAGGPGLVFSLFVLTAAAWLFGQHVWAGVLAAFTLLAGPWLWLGVLVLALAWGVHWFFYRAAVDLPGEQIKRAAIALGITLLLAGTLFLRYPQGLSAFASSLPAFLSAWVTPDGAPWQQVSFALLAYQPLAFGFAMVAFFRREGAHAALFDFFKLWLVIGLAVLLVFPGRQVTDLVWLAIPLWGLAVVVIAGFLPRGELARSSVAWSFAVLVFLFASFSWLNLAEFSRLQPVPLADLGSMLTSGGGGGFANLPPNTQFFTIRLIVMILMPLLTLVSTVMIAMGWSEREAVSGLVWGLLVFFGMWGLAATWNLAFLLERAANELWFAGTTAGQSEMLLETVGDISEYAVGTRGDIDVVYQVDSAALAWALRDLPRVSYAAQLPLGELPSLLITTSNVDEPLLAAAYSGQSFPLSYARDWGGPLPKRLAGWLVYREAPTTAETVILWVRADLFPEGSLLPSMDEQTPVEDAEPSDELFPERAVP